MTEKTFKKTSDVQNIQRLSLLFATIFCAASLIYLISIPQAHSYEISIYSALPTQFWFLFLSSAVLVATFIILYTFNPVKKKYFFLSIFLIIMIFSIFFLLPVLRGYGFLAGARGWSAILARMGRVETILQSGHVWAEDFYPAPQILVAKLNILGLGLLESVLILQLIIQFLYVAFLYYYLRETELEANFYYLMIFCSLPLAYLRFHVIYTPAVMSLLIIPLFLYLLKKDEKMVEDHKFKILLTMIAILIVFFHPFTTLMLILMIAIMFFSKLIYQKFNSGIAKASNYGYGLLVLFITFFLYHSRFEYFEEGVQRAINTLLYSANDGPGEETASMVGETGLTPFQIFLRFVQNYGVVWIFGGVALICVIFIGKKFLFKRKFSHLEFIYFIQFFVGIGVTLFMLTTPFFEVEIVRFSRYAILIFTLVIGIYTIQNINIFKNMKDGSRNSIKFRNHFKISAIIIIGLILLSLPLSMVTVYEQNSHLTHSEIEGVDWYLKHGDLEKETIHGSMGFRMIQYLYGAEPEVERADGNTTEIERGDVFGSSDDRKEYPKHLGYEENETVAETFGENVYIITSPYDYNWYMALFSNQLENEYFDYYTEEDLEKLENDPTANKLYSNGEFIIWYVKY